MIAFNRVKNIFAACPDALDYVHAKGKVYDYVHAFSLVRKENDSVIEYCICIEYGTVNLQTKWLRNPSLLTVDICGAVWYDLPYGATRLRHTVGRTKTLRGSATGRTISSQSLYRQNCFNKLKKICIESFIEK